MASKRKGASNASAVEGGEGVGGEGVGGEVDLTCDAGCISLLSEEGEEEEEDGRSANKPNKKARVNSNGDATKDGRAWAFVLDGGEQLRKAADQKGWRRPTSLGKRPMGSSSNGDEVGNTGAPLATPVETTEAFGADLELPVQGYNSTCLCGANVPATKKTQCVLCQTTVHKDCCTNASKNHCWWCTQHASDQDKTLLAQATITIENLPDWAANELDGYEGHGRLGEQSKLVAVMLPDAATRVWHTVAIKHLRSEYMYATLSLVEVFTHLTSERLAFADALVRVEGTTMTVLARLWITSNGWIEMPTMSHRSVGAGLMRSIFSATWPNPARSDAIEWQMRDLLDVTEIGGVDNSHLCNVSASTLGAAMADQPLRLVSKLFPFQRRALKWMLHREKDTEAVDSPLWECVRSASGVLVYIDRLYGFVSTVPPKQLPIARGGILAEEMGLGKTVELLSLVVANTPSRVWFAENINLTGEHGVLKPSHTTLIVTPSSILYQWKNEIETHAPHLTVHHYTGMRKAGDGYHVSLDKLVTYDIILVTYDVLQAELVFALPPPKRNMRFEKRYERHFSPLTMIHFWRVCLDEAQMIETPTAKSAELVRSLSASNRWAITGTPIGRRGLPDLHGLFLFLQQEALVDTVEFQYLLKEATHYALKDWSQSKFALLLSKILWRTARKVVGHEITLPPQTQYTIPLQFQEFERYNYNTLYDQCVKALEQSSNEDTTSSVFGLLVHLRQTCCHPQIGEQNKNVFGDKPLPMKQVLQLRRKAIFSDLGAAERHLCSIKIKLGLMLERLEPPNLEAVLDIYKHELDGVVLQVAKFKKLLADMSTDAGGVEESADDVHDKKDEISELESVRDQLRQWIETEHRVRFLIASVHLEQKLDDVATKEFDEAELVRLELMHPIEEKAQQAIQREMELKEAAAARFSEAALLIDPNEFKGGVVGEMAFDKIRETCLTLNENIKSLLKLREVVFVNVFKKLHENYENDANDQAVVDETMAEIKGLLQTRLNHVLGGVTTWAKKDLMTREEKKKARTYHEDDDEATNEEDFMQGLAEKYQYKDTSLNNMMQLIQSFAEKIDTIKVERMRNLEHGIITNAVVRLNEIIKHQNSFVEDMNKETKRLGNLANVRIAYYRQLQAISDNVAHPEIHGSVEEEIESLERRQTEETAVVKGLQHHLQYLDNLCNEHDETKIPEQMCPICHMPIAERGLLTPCNHLFCECVVAWTTTHRACPICKQPLTGRGKAAFKEIIISQLEDDSTDAMETTSTSAAEAGSGVVAASSSLWSREFKSPAFDKKIFVVGSWGTKFEAIIRHIKWLSIRDPETKVLVFSQWGQVLAILTKALMDNGVGCVRFEGVKTSSEAINSFRNNANSKVLLLNSQKQSSGLTLIQATHVFLVEPVLNASMELQAVHRVHRIGQTKPTFVYRYLVEDTVEEKVFERTRPLLMQSEEEHAAPSSSSSSSSSSAAADAALNGGDGNVVLESAFGSRDVNENISADDIKFLLASAPRTRVTPKTGLTTDDPSSSFDRGRRAIAAERRNFC